MVFTSSMTSKDIVNDEGDECNNLSARSWFQRCSHKRCKVLQLVLQPVLQLLGFVSRNLRVEDLLNLIGEEDLGHDRNDLRRVLDDPLDTVRRIVHLVPLVYFSIAVIPTSIAPIWNLHFLVGPVRVACSRIVESRDECRPSCRSSRSSSASIA